MDRFEGDRGDVLETLRDLTEVLERALDTNGILGDVERRESGIEESWLPERPSVRASLAGRVMKVGVVVQDGGGIGWQATASGKKAFETELARSVRKRMAGADADSQTTVATTATRQSPCLAFCRQLTRSVHLELQL